MPNYRNMIDECLTDLNDRDLRDILNICLTKHETTAMPEEVVEVKSGMFRGTIKIFGETYKNINAACQAHDIRPSFIYTKGKGKSTIEVQMIIEAYLEKKQAKKKRRPPERRLLGNVGGKIVAS